MKSLGYDAKPILGVDVWEHAYYLKYKNMRPDYVKNFLECVNWKVVSDKLAKAMKGPLKALIVLPFLYGAWNISKNNAPLNNQQTPM